jgi:DNA-binding transcriptional ArsR family regulator
VLDQTFGALADPTRRALLARLARGPASTSELAAPFAFSLPAVLKHLAVLELAGLVHGEKRGRVRRYRLRATPMRHAAAWLEEYRAFWESHLDALEHYLEEQQP